MIRSMVCYYSAVAGDCVVLRDAAGVVIRTKALPMNYADFARRVDHRYWRLAHVGPGSFHFVRKT